MPPLRDGDGLAHICTPRPWLGTSVKCCPSDPGPQLRLHRAGCFRVLLSERSIQISNESLEEAVRHVWGPTVGTVTPQDTITMGMLVRGCLSLLHGVPI